MPKAVDKPVALLKGRYEDLGTGRVKRTFVLPDRASGSCAVCENPTRLAQLAAQQSVRQLSPGERASFGVS